MSTTLKVDQIKENQNMEHKVYQLFIEDMLQPVFLYVNMFRYIFHFDHTPLNNIVSK